MSTRALHVIDPELHPTELAQIPSGAPACTFFNPLHDAVLTSTQPRRASGAELRRWFDELYEVIVAARQAGIARARIDGLDSHEIDFAAVLEVGFATELHVCVASHLEPVTASRAVVWARRAVFAEIAASFLRGRGVDVRVVQLPSNASTAAPRKIGDRVHEAGSMAARWLRADLRVLGAQHRQTTPVLRELADSGIATATPTLASALDIGTRRLVTARSCGLDRAEEATVRLRRFGERRLDGALAVAWRSMLDMFERRLPPTVEQIARRLLALDLLTPDAIIAPAWGGADAHSMRAWCRSRGVPFAVVQHGFNIGARSCVRTGAVDADLFYAWSGDFVRDWIDLTLNEHVGILGTGNPAYHTYRGRAPGAPIETVMLAPAGVLDFNRASLLEFWDGAFDAVESLDDTELRWKLRPHGHGRNNDWIRSRGEQLGCVWSRDAEPGLDEALADVDILVTMFSSVAIDAMVRGILVVVTNHLGEEPLFLPDAAGAYTTDPSDLPRLVRELTESPESRAEAYRRQQSVVDAYPTRGTARAVARDLRSRLTKS